MKYSWLILIAGIMMSCGGSTPPQQPSHRSGEADNVDSSLIMLMNLNSHMMEEADRQLLLYSKGFALRESGCWTRGLKVNDAPFATDERVTLHLSIYSLDGTLLEDITETVKVGQIDRMEALSEIVPELTDGDSITLLVPWYLGYGTTGNEHVAPYTNLQIELTSKR